MRNKDKTKSESMRLQQHFSDRVETKPYSLIVVHIPVSNGPGRSELRERVVALCDRMVRRGTVHTLSTDTLVVALPGMGPSFAEWTAMRIEELGTKAILGRGTVRACSVQASPRESFADVLGRGAYYTASCPRAA